ncbi:hypothetical protein CRUP_006827 [Coryphaenoides rupestris]|nr:hypothetical protein CRUP_006827 [Coryphaenoides rupestris]
MLSLSYLSSAQRRMAITVTTMRRTARTGPITQSISGSSACHATAETPSTTGSENGLATNICCCCTVVVSELGEDKAEAEPLAWQGSVVVAPVVPLVTQRERLGQRLQLGGDVRLGDVLQLSPPAVQWLGIQHVRSRPDGHLLLETACAVPANHQHKGVIRLRQQTPDQLLPERTIRPFLSATGGGSQDSVVDVAPVCSPTISLGGCHWIRAVLPMVVLIIMKWANRGTHPLLWWWTTLALLRGPVSLVVYAATVTE